MEKATEEQRILWIDVLKGVLMLMVVIGHATSMFNPYIYQFHVGAFFILSGYTARKKNKVFLKSVLQKFVSLGAPLICSFTLLLLFSKILNVFSLHNVVFGSEFLGIMYLLKEFLKGNIYINWLGAAWFIIVLFGVFLFKEFTFIFTKRLNIYVELVLSILVAILGVLIQTIVGSNVAVLILYAQLFFTLGRFLAETKLFDKVFFSKGMWVLGILGSLYVMMYIKSKKISMDFATGDFPELLIMLVMVLNGMIFCYILSVIISQKEGVLCRGLMKIGQNTLGILLFHFIGFKIAYIVLIVFKQMSWQDFILLCPATEIGRKWWWLITAISISFAYVLWNIICRNRISKIIFGQDKLVNNKIIEKLFSNKKIVYVATAIVLVWFVIGFSNTLQCGRLLHTGKQLIVNGYYVTNKWEDNFLGYDTEIIFLPGGKNEVEISLYNPESFKENQVTVYVDNVYYTSFALQNGNNNIRCNKGNGKNIRLLFSNVTIPAEVSESNDERELSCVLSEIKFIN